MIRARGAIMKSDAHLAPTSHFGRSQRGPGLLKAIEDPRVAMSLLGAVTVLPLRPAHYTALAVRAVLAEGAG
jgi:hypothetical protein